MKGWTLTTISKTYKRLYDGPHATPTPSDSGKIFLRIENITKDGHLDFTKTTYISDDDYPRWTKRVVPTKGDIVFSYEATLGRYAIIPENFQGCLGRRIALIRPDNSKALGKYLYYYFYSSLWKEEIGNYLITGATVDRIPLIKFPKFKILLPSLTIQRKIAAILSTYDDLIENNNCRIAILEKTAEELYREWFVRMRFPGHEKTKIVKGVPEGWETKKVEDLIVRISVGKRYDDKTILPEGRVPVLDQGQSGIIGYHNDEPSVLASFEDPIIVFANHTCYQRMIFYPFSAIQNVLPFRPSNKIPSNIYWLHYATKDLIELSEYKGHWPEFTKKFLFYPGQKLTEQFGYLIRPLMVNVISLQKVNILLKQSRDRLLTRLMSGKLDVEKLDIRFPKSMEEGLA